MGFFELVTDHLQNVLGRACTLALESRHSGPMVAREDVFASGDADLGFLCSPSYLWLRQQQPASVTLVPAAPVPDDPRCKGRPVYFSEVVVRAEHEVTRFEQLAGQRFVYNDDSSLSGYFSLWKRVVDAGWDQTFFGKLECCGSHVAALEAIAGRQADAAAIDAQVLGRWSAAQPDSAARLRVLETLGPFPIQPVVIRRELAAELAIPVAEALLSLSGGELIDHGVRGFHPVDERGYEEELDLLQLPQSLPSGVRWLDRY